MAVKPNNLAIIVALETAFNRFAPNGQANGQANEVEPIDEYVRKALEEPRYAVTFVPGLIGIAFVSYRRRSFYLKYNYAISAWVALKR